MNYQKLYDQIIQNAIKQNRVKNNFEYYESHHILPRCLGGIDNTENKVFLTFREHFICHWLLCKIYKKTIKKLRDTDEVISVQRMKKQVRCKSHRLNETM
jgi:hypothetical protein